MLRAGERGEVPTGTPPVGEILAQTQKFLRPALPAAVADLPAPLRLLVGYQFGWWDEGGRPEAGDGGKAVRPVLMLLCANAVGGVDGDALPAAVAVELVHNFSLVHDDVMDGDRTRRHRPTVWSLPVTFVLDGAGITGPSHHGIWDLSTLAIVPGLKLAAPRDPATLRTVLHEAVTDTTGPTAIRFPRATAGTDIAAIALAGTAEILRQDENAETLLIPVGTCAEAALWAAANLAAAGIAVTVIDPRWAVPLDPAVISIAARYPVVVTIEDNVRTGGFGVRLALASRDLGADNRLRVLTLPKAFLAHGARSDILRAHGLDGPGIATAARDEMARAAGSRRRQDAHR